MKRILLPALAALMLAACEKQLDIDVDDLEPIVVVNSICKPGSAVQMSVTWSRPILGFHSYSQEYGFTTVEGATAELTVNGSERYTATTTDSLLVFPYIAQAYDSLQVEVHVPDYGTLKASTRVPLPPSVGEVTPRVDTAANNEVIYNLRIPLSDPAGQRNYYSIRIVNYMYSHAEFDGDSNLVNYSHVDSSDMWFNCSDPLVVSTEVTDLLEGMETAADFSGEEMYFDDSRIDGTTHNIDVSYSIYFYDMPEDLAIYARVHVNALSREEYLYRVSAENAYYDELSGLFSEPGVVYSNVEGGAGVLGAHSSRQAMVHCR